jgi:hypothetical protein|tara:strand:+ start:441 stop:911 length:471 start_codon:yes stop_codon:yes gene_type:complete
VLRSEVVEFRRRVIDVGEELCDILNVTRSLVDNAVTDFNGTNCSQFLWKYEENELNAFMEKYFELVQTVDSEHEQFMLENNLSIVERKVLDKSVVDIGARLSALLLAVSENYLLASSFLKVFEDDRYVVAKNIIDQSVFMTNLDRDNITSPNYFIP